MHEEALALERSESADTKNLTSQAAKLKEKVTEKWKKIFQEYTDLSEQIPVSKRSKWSELLEKVSQKITH